MDDHSGPLCSDQPAHHWWVHIQKTVTENTNGAQSGKKQSLHYHGIWEKAQIVM